MLKLSNWLDGGYTSAKDDYKKTLDENTGAKGMQKAQELGQSGALTRSQMAGQNVSGLATNAGMTKGQASAVAGSAQNRAATSSLNSEIANAAQANREEVGRAEKDVAEANEKRAERQQMAQGIGDIAQAGIGAGLSIATGNPMAGALYSAAATPVRQGLTSVAPMAGKTGGTVLTGISSLLSDERAKYRSRIHNRRLLP